MPGIIGGSVGAGNAANSPDDVRTVQSLLNTVPELSGGPATPLDVTGVINDDTIAAITAFQNARYTSADGKVDPIGRTISDLKTYSDAAADPDPRADRPEVFCDVRVSNGPCGPRMMAALRQVERSLRDQSPLNSDFRSLNGIEAVDGHQNRKKSIAIGKAVDLSANTNPYIVTRTIGGGGITFGGEGGGASVIAAKRPFIAQIYDRAVAWANPGKVADVGIRRPNEATADVYARFRLVSSSLSTYLGFAINANGPAPLKRPVIPNVETADFATLLNAIPAAGAAAERLPEDVARGNIRDFLARSSVPPPPFLSNDIVQAWLGQMLRDYDLMRLPLVNGDPSLSPGSTRNPVRGFLQLPFAVVDAMVRNGLAWGACDLGPDQSGDIMHFQFP